MIRVNNIGGKCSIDESCRESSVNSGYTLISKTVANAACGRVCVTVMKSVDDRLRDKMQRKKPAQKRRLKEETMPNARHWSNPQ